MGATLWPAPHLATAMSKPVVRVCPFSVGDCPTVISLRKRSFVSITLRHVIVSGSTSSRTNLRQEATQRGQERPTGSHIIMVGGSLGSPAPDPIVPMCDDKL